MIELNDQARRFAEEYLIDFRVGAAAERAGYNAAYGSLLIADPRVDALIREGKRRASERVNVSVDMVLENFRLMSLVSVADYFVDVAITKPCPITGMPIPTGDFYQRLKPIGEWTDAMRFALKAVKHTKHGPTIELHDKKLVNDSLAKYFGMFVDRSEVSGPGGGPVQMITPEMDAKQAAEAYAATLTAGK